MPCVLEAGAEPFLSLSSNGRSCDLLHAQPSPSVSLSFLVRADCSYHCSSPFIVLLFFSLLVAPFFSLLVFSVAVSGVVPSPLVFFAERLAQFLRSLLLLATDASLFLIGFLFAFSSFLSGACL